MRRAALLLAVAATASCKKTSESKYKPPPPVAVDAALPVAPADAPPDAPPPPPADAGIAAVEGDASPELLVRAARVFASGEQPDVVLVRISASYVRADGTFDPKYGTLDVEFGNSSRPLELVDDPSRPTGAPLPPPPEDAKPRTNGCLKPRWAEGTWTIRHGFCRKVEPVLGPRCTAKAIWDRAITAGAPKDALAVLSIDGPSRALARPMWRFTISDRLRKVNFERYFEDDCPLAIESGSAN